VKKQSKSVYIYGSYGKIKTGVSLFWTTHYVHAKYMHYANIHAYMHKNLCTAR